MLNRKWYQASKPEMEFHMINIIYATLPMYEQREKMIFITYKDDSTLTKHTRCWTYNIFQLFVNHAILRNFLLENNLQPFPSLHITWYGRKSLPFAMVKDQQCCNQGANIADIGNLVQYIEGLTIFGIDRLLENVPCSQYQKHILFILSLSIFLAWEWKAFSSKMNKMWHCNITLNFSLSP